MKVLRVLRQCVLGLAVLSLAACSSDDETANDAQLKAQALQIVGQMSTRDKIGQKIMMAFRYWCEPPADPNCTDRMTVLPDAAASALRDHRIGGVVLFANNLVSVDQISRLTAQIAAAAPVGMLIGVDEEGGNVFRLPRGIATSFPGNMALGAAYLGAADAALASDEGRVLASELAAVGMNVNFAPVVDVNSNPLNPVINVRAYGDDPAMVGLLGRHMARGMAHAGVISAFKHFPGHGDAATDSHYGLPRVDKSRADAYATDLAPYRASIDLGEAPEMIMTAHIQYPSLDETRVATRTGESILVPATMSRKIQHDLLRGEFGYRGVTVSDALDMDAIANHFDPDQAVINLFRADVDIALMPVEFRTAGQADRLRAVIDRVVAALDAGTLSRAELDASVERITLMKLRHGIAPNASRPQTSAVTVIGSPGHRAAEQRIAQASITLLRNRGATLPLNAPQRPIFIMTPWGEQAQGMRQRFAELGYASVTGAKLAETPWAEQQRLIDAADIVILGTLSSAPLRSSAMAIRAPPTRGRIPPRCKRVLRSPSTTSAPRPLRTGNAPWSSMSRGTRRPCSGCCARNRSPRQAKRSGSAMRWSTPRRRARPSSTYHCARRMTCLRSTMSLTRRLPPIRTTATTTAPGAVRRCRHWSMRWPVCARRLAACRCRCMR